MKAVVDALDSQVGWTPGAGSSITASAVNQVSDFVAGLNSGSLVISIPSGSAGKSISKTISFDFTGYDEVAFSVWSRNERGHGLDAASKASDFAYSVDFGTGTVFYLPVPRSFDDVTLSVAGLGKVSKITITALTNDADHLILSNMVAAHEEIPLDIFRGIKEQIDHDVLDYYAKMTNGVSGKGVLIGTVSGNRLDRKLALTDSLSLIDRYAVILIDDGANSEIHQLDTNDELGFFFTRMYDGDQLLHDHASASVYLKLPCEYGMDEKEIVLPGIVIGGMVPEEVDVQTKIETDVDTFTTDGAARERHAPVNFRYEITVDCYARQNSILADMSRVVRRLVAREYFWMNGKKINVRNPRPAQHFQPIAGFNEIPRIQIAFDVDVREEVAERAVDAAAVKGTTTYNLETTVPVAPI